MDYRMKTSSSRIIVYKNKTIISVVVLLPFLLCSQSAMSADCHVSCLRASGLFSHRSTVRSQLINVNICGRVAAVSYLFWFGLFLSVLNPDQINKLLLQVKFSTSLQSVFFWRKLVTAWWMQYLWKTALCNEYWATISPQNWFTVLGCDTRPAIPQQSTTCYRHYSWKEWEEMAQKLEQHSHATNITHIHAWRKRGKMSDSVPKNCMLLPEGI